MSVVAQSNSTYAQIELTVRRLTALSSQSALPSSEIQEQVNNFYNNNLPQSIKTDTFRSVYSFLTRPYVDKYPLDVNYNQGVRAPMYVDGIPGSFYKDRDQFFSLFPRFPTQFQPAEGDGVTTVFAFTVTGPFLSGQVTLGCTSTTGTAISVSDVPTNVDGIGNLYVQVPNPVVSVPTYGSVYPVGSAQAGMPIPGLYNKNTLNPGLYTSTYIGTVNYVTGAFSMDFSLANVIPDSGSIMTLWVSTYQTAKPWSLLFWNNEFTIRPVPQIIHKIEVEVYLTPVQFLLTSDSPILNQWANYVAYGSAMEILRQRQDMAGVENLREGFLYQEGMVLERQGTEEIGQQNQTIYNSVAGGYNNTNGWYNGGWAGY